MAVGAMPPSLRPLPPWLPGASLQVGHPPSGAWHFHRGLGPGPDVHRHFIPGMQPPTLSVVPVLLLLLWGSAGEREADIPV